MQAATMRYCVCLLPQAGASTSEPFFLYFPLGIPHEPIVPSADFDGKSGAHDLVKQEPKYGDWVFQGDAMLGKLIEALERNKLAENTLILVTSDNGAEHRAYEPLRESKRSIYEGGASRAVHRAMA